MVACQQQRAGNVLDLCSSQGKLFLLPCNTVAMIKLYIQGWHELCYDLTLSAAQQTHVQQQLHSAGSMTSYLGEQHGQNLSSVFVLQP